MGTLVDTSVWIDYLRADDSASHRRLRELREADPERVLTCEPIAMELLFGPTNEFTLRRIERVVDGLNAVDVDPDLDFRAAAEVFRAVKRIGHTPRSAVDCLIAAIALRHDVMLLHKDADFEVIAEVTGLRHESLREPG